MLPIPNEQTPTDCHGDYEPRLHSGQSGLSHEEQPPSTVSNEFDKDSSAPTMALPPAIGHLTISPTEDQFAGEEAAMEIVATDIAPAGAPPVLLSSDLSGAVAPPPEPDRTSRFSYVSVVARQRAAAAAVAEEDRSAHASLPPPMVRRKRPAMQLTLQTHHQLPDETPLNHTHRLIGRHPWAHYVTLREDPLPSDPESVTSLLPTSIYRHIKGGGYLSTRFVYSLFPRSFRESPSSRHRLPIAELMRLEHAVVFREMSHTIINQLQQRTYQPVENSLPPTPTRFMPSVTLPEPKPNFPVLYQVVSRGPGQGLTLEAKDFFIMGPDRMELHLIKLDQFATNVVSNTRGFDRALVSVKDLVWIYSLDPTPAAVRDYATVLLKEFTFVTPPSVPKRGYGIILSLLRRYNSTKGLRIAFESAPDAVPVSPAACDFPVENAREDEFVTALSRHNTSTAIRFYERPVSKEAREQLCNLIRVFVPAHPQEGLLPLKVFKLTAEERAWLDDRATNFINYRKDPRVAQRRMAQIFNVACSALAAISNLNDDQRTHGLTAVIPSMDAFPLCFDFTIPDMSAECGWTHHRPVYLWIVGSRSLVRATIQRSDHSYKDRSLSVRLVAPVWAHRTLFADCQTHGSTIDGTTSIAIRVRLGMIPAGADPVYEIISSLQLFQNLSFASNSRANDILDTVYGDLRPPIGPVGPPSEFAAFGTGKTVIGAFLAARIFRTQRSTVIATTTTNTAVAQFTDTLLRLDDERNLDVLRFVCDSALLDGTPTTPVDIHTVLKRLADDYGHRMSDEAVRICRRYKRGRELLETYLFNPDRALRLTEVEREEYRMAEREVSDITNDVVRIMFEVRPPAVLCLTTSALLNAATSGGIFCELLADVRTIIVDEASQIPEPAMVAIATRFQQARHVYIGDTHQLEPHARCPRSSNPARYGARGVMELLLAKGVPSAPLNTTFRSHPNLLPLPNRLFYNQTLVSGTEASDRTMRAINGSHSNDVEAEVCRQLVLSLLSKALAPSSIAVIAFYKEQLRLLEGFAQAVSVDVYTVDSVQGRENDVTILLTTRTHFDPAQGEFLDDPRRLNVALTRCRHGQLVLGHERSLRQLPNWARVLDWAHSVRGYTTDSALPDLLD
ncbi:hypothetical protein Q1695_003274 [Nippostrongylus brasiliensis]|nr:hypothetical protein Q1695_003274 [Nippostrongylus brasiliensis]